ncbi:hypothetical protein QBC45DRAFT_328045, partial [Copromyces sp. CBS 386.78]
VSTLKDRIRKRIPIINIREAKIPLNIFKLSTLPTILKLIERYRFEVAKYIYNIKNTINNILKKAIKIIRE